MKITRLRAGAALVAAAALSLTACEPAVQSPTVATTDAEDSAGSAADDTSADTAGASAGGTAGGEGAGDVTAAAALVEQVSAPVDAFTAPGPELGDLSSLAGGTVYYVPATLQVPMFTNVGDAIAEALGNVDVDVQVCDGKANPADIANCLGQAVNGGADAVIAGSIPQELAGTAFQGVQDAGIPLLFMQTAPAGPGAPDKVAYLTPNYVQMQAWNASWVVADADGAADVLVVKVTDTPATILWIEQGALATYEQYPDTEVTVVETNTGQLDKLPSLVSSALVRDPDIGYVHVAFDVTVQPTVQGIQSAGRTDVKVVSQDGVLPVMQSLGQGQFLASEVGFNQEALGWYAADQVLRMMSGQESVQNLEFPYRRLFTRDTAADLTLTPEGEATGEWYGDTGYKQGFLQLWGVDAR